MNKRKKVAIKRFLACRKLKTIWFNFKVLPFSQARKLPFFIYGKSTFRSLEGQIVIDAPVRPGMILIGKNDYYVGTNVQQTIWTINGKLIFKGPFKFLHGSNVVVSRTGTLTLGGKESLFGSDCKVICFDSITIGENARITWECQFMDTSFHYIEENGRKARPLTKPISIGANVWIGNRTTVSKGAVIPDNTIVASNSLVNKDFSGSGPNIMLAGVPASTKATNIRRVFDERLQKELDKEYGYDRTHL